jgi:hypothetical protein
VAEHTLDFVPLHHDLLERADLPCVEKGFSALFQMLAEESLTFDPFPCKMTRS